jgi:hypothetical protein
MRAVESTVPVLSQAITPEQAGEEVGKKAESATGRHVALPADLKQ